MDKNNINLIFKDHSSICRSILTEWPAQDEIKDNEPVSIWSIAKKYELEKVMICNNTFLSFISHYKEAQKLNKQLIFGIEFFVVENALDLSEDSLLTESKVQVYMKNSAGYKDLIKLYSKANSDKDRFYYNGRLEWSDLKDINVDNLQIVFPFFDNFLHKNLLTYKSRCIPNFYNKKPVFCLEPLKDLPFCDLITQTILDYTKTNGFDTMNTHSAFYFRESDIDSYCCFRTINGRSSFNKPNLSHFSSSKWAVETWLNSQNIKI